jgi:hypothetical protein
MKERLIVAWHILSTTAIIAFVISYFGLLALIIIGPTNWFSGFVFSWITRYRNRPGIVLIIFAVWALILLIDFAEEAIRQGREEDKKRYDRENHIF